MTKKSGSRLTRNWGLKLLSFVLAFIVWIVMIPQEKTFSEKTLTIPLEIRNLPQDMELVEKPTATVEITIRARNRLLNELPPSAIVARLDLGRASVYQEIFPLNKSLVSLPPGTEFVGISPNVVRLKIDKTKVMELEVVPMIVGKAPEGFRLAGIEVFPSLIRVRGPESRIRSRDKLSTSPVDISRLTQTTTVEADIILPKPDLRLVTSLTKVRVEITIEPVGKATEGNGRANGRK